MRMRCVYRQDGESEIREGDIVGIDVDESDGNAVTKVKVSTEKDPIGLRAAEVIAVIMVE